MSTVALQRFIVRLMFDASLARRLQEQPRQAMKGVALTELEQQWLLASDMRGYRSDPLFAPRLLHAVVGECAVSTGLALAHLRKPSHVLLAFFQSPNAHGAVQHGKSLTLAYADWLIGRVVSGRWAEPRVAQVARLEKCLAEPPATWATLRRNAPMRGAGTNASQYLGSL